MSLAVRRAAPLAALLTCALAAGPAHAQGPGNRLVAQIAQATPAPSPAQEPPLTPRPPAPLGTPTPTPTPAATVTSDGVLARTGSDAGLIALAGLSLLGAGVGLRRAVVDGTAV
jgi:hypothetical protein